MMAEGEDDKKDGAKSKDASDDRRKSQVEPVPKRQDFFEWLDKLFVGPAEFPEKIETRIVSGPRYERLGPVVKQKVWPPKSPKPSKQEIVALSNELLFLMQRDCDIHRKPTVYGVHAAHFQRESDYYERFLVRCNPSSGGRSANDGLTVIERDDDESNLEQRHSIQILSHHARMFELYGGGYEGMIDRYERAAASDRAEIERLRNKCNDLQNQLERALDLEIERNEKREWLKVKSEAVAKSVERGFALADMLLPKLLGNGKGTTLTVTEDVKILAEFFKMRGDGGLLTEEQANAAFGEYEKEPPHNLRKRGVLSPEQAEILFRVAHGQCSPDKLDSIIPGGEYAVDMSQLFALQKIFSDDQIAPLKKVFQARMQRKTQQQ